MQTKMTRNTYRFSTLAFAILFLAAQGFAADFNPPPRVVSPCGSPHGICGGGGGGGGGGSSGCETSSWGDFDEGGSITVCVQPDGSSSWTESEWGDGYYVEDWGKVTNLGDGKVSVRTGSGDYAWY